MIERKGFLKKISVKLILLLLLIDLLIGSLFVYFYLTQIIPSNLVMIFTGIPCLFIMSMLLNELSIRLVDKRFKRKVKPKVFYLESLKFLDSSMKKVNVEIKSLKYGISYLYIRNKVAYKILVVNDVDAYFNSLEDTSEKKLEKNSKLEQCEKFLAFEIFETNDEEFIKKIELYNFQTEKVYYGGFYYVAESRALVQAQFEAPFEAHHDNYEFIINLIGMAPNAE